MTTPLEPPDSHHLRAAIGWIELGNHLEANEELEQIAARNRAHPDVLEVRLQVYAAAMKWEACADLGQGLVMVAPDRSFGWIFRSLAFHKLKRTQEAYDGLEPAAALFVDSWHIRYDLACYACQLKMNDQAREWLVDAFDLADSKNLKLRALSDLDLEPFWAGIGEI